ncbi:RagB/SusD family nutrient uptake outer membrane protein [Pedobacter sp. L105]|uniref:RagB/SusD family nutrient uptake outer membrane protein n=1 Tax=Pedobacter sp. L105 TaxID=1641871 RepID=UPI00131E893A|nr:RagB/SusD family nutrient uptake outer membrane protein [Pedobacter sp. L105]
MKVIKKKLVLFILMIATSNYSCKKFLEVGPPKDQATSTELFSNDASATSAITGVYSRMVTSGAFSGNQNSISALCGLSADDFNSYNSSLALFDNNDIPTTNFVLQTFLWQEPYAYIYTSNAVLKGLKTATGVSASTNKQLQGEAKFIRAFCYFYLVNLFGDVPLNLSSDYTISELTPRSSTAEIYNQIIADLTDAENLLSENYITSERVRPNKWTAEALLSRVYLYTGKWDLAIQAATDVINQTSTYALVDNLNGVFLKNSTEAIWQLLPTAGRNTREGTLFILTSTPIFVSLSPSFVSQFAPNDNRKTQWINQFTNSTGTYYYPYKYKVRTTINGSIVEYSMVIRLAELYLIRAEAQTELGQSNLALNDINIIRKRAGLITPLLNLNSEECLTEIEKQRHLELFSEWGHRWLDLKRTNRASAVLSLLKGSSWKETDALYPIPEVDISRNPKITQNPGY